MTEKINPACCYIFVRILNCEVKCFEYGFNPPVIYPFHWYVSAFATQEIQARSPNSLQQMRVGKEMRRDLGSSSGKMAAQRW